MRIAVTVLVFCVAGLLALGMVMLYSSSMVQSGAHYLLMQLLWCGVGLVASSLAAILDYRHLRKIWWLLLGAAIVLLGLVLIPSVGWANHGARRWFNFHGLSFQPSEFGKLALLIGLAWYGEHFRRQMSGWIKGILIPGLVIAVVTGLIFKEPDVGNALVLGAVSSCVLLLAGIRLRYFFPPALLAAVAVGVFIYYNPVRSERVYAWLHLEETREAKGMQGYEAMLALGSGGLTGKGLGDSSQNGFVPFHHTDFIFAIIGEELGLVATLLVVAAFAAILASGLYIALRAPDTFGLLLGAGIIFLISLQALVNIGVVTSALPNKGLPLPFISYGGTNLVLMLTGIGLVLSIARHSREHEALASRAADEPISGNPFARPKTASA